MTRRALLSALAAAPLLRYLEPLARWIAPTPEFFPEHYFDFSQSRIFETDWIPLTYYPGTARIISVTVPETGE